MSFREKSAWGMGLLLVMTGLWYLSIAVRIPLAAPPAAQLGAALPFTLAMVIGSIVIHIVLAIASPKDAVRAADERERVAIDRAGHWSGIVLGFGVVSGAIHYLIYGEPNLLFHVVISSMIVSQIAEYAFQIVLFRRAV